MLIHIIYDRSQTDGTAFDPLKGIIRFLGATPDGWSYGEQMPLAELPEEQAPIYLALAGAIQGKGGTGWQRRYGRAWQDRTRCFSRLRPGRMGRGQSALLRLMMIHL